MPTFINLLRALSSMSSPPGAASLLKSWLYQRVTFFVNPSRHSFRVAGITVSGPTRRDVLELFNDIFLLQSYYAVLPPRPRIIDCGANIGCATLYFKLLAPDALITCFEPSPIAFSYLQRNIEYNRIRDVVMIQAACGVDNAPVVLRMDPGHSTGSTIKDIWQCELQKCEVQQVRLSEHINESVDLLKLDVEGAEWDVIADLVTSGKIAFISRMIIEFHHNLGSQESSFGEFLRIIEGAGFTYTLGASRSYADRFSTSWQAIMLYAWRTQTE